MRYKIGDIFTFADNTKGTVIEAKQNIIGGEEYEINVNGETKYIIIDENGRINNC